MLLLLVAVTVTVMLQQKKTALFPFPPTTASRCVLYNVKKPLFCTFSNAGKLLQMFFSSHIVLGENVFFSCNAPLGVLSALSLCLQDNLFQQPPLSRSVLN